MISPSELKERLLANKIKTDYSENDPKAEWDSGFNTALDRALQLVTELQQAAEIVERPFIKLSEKDRIISLYCTRGLYDAVNSLDSTVGESDPMAIFKIYKQMKVAFKKKA